MKGAVQTQQGAAGRLSARPSLPSRPISFGTLRSCKKGLRLQAQGEKADLSGEWPVNWSLASYEDVGEFFQNMFKDTAAPGTQLKDVMSTTLTVVTPETSVENAKKLLTKVTGVPVVKTSSDWTLLGVLSKKDVQIKDGKNVSDIMSKPPIAARPDNKVADAACLMLKHKVHRIPVVDNTAKLVGIVTRTDIFTALENETSSVDVKVKL